MADAQASGACGSNIVWVQVPSPAFIKQKGSSNMDEPFLFFTCFHDFPDLRKIIANTVPVLLFPLHYERLFHAKIFRLLTQPVCLPHQVLLRYRHSNLHIPLSLKLP